MTAHLPWDLATPPGYVPIRDVLTNRHAQERGRSTVRDDTKVASHRRPLTVRDTHVATRPIVTVGHCAAMAASMHSPLSDVAGTRYAGPKDQAQGRATVWFRFTQPTRRRS